ncbi:ISKra4 family transposase [Methylobacterium nonmethylotrophicum]|uniref:ISKra4 family transposase n=1 Tax=Methylobacterium nonmethylotrophicum TaxID=1141884 RepID=A0A4Z0NHR0_9HYPH|nr:ISKra4 family transposase [Methylobacterium nonmethylotrophicum]TGD95207.1 ISKra4 family transposase [Methylobacterium nonmethylotrophicum]
MMAGIRSEHPAGFVGIRREDQQGAAAVIDRPDELAPETLGLTLAEAHALLRDVQARLVAAQVERWQAAHRACPACGTVRGLKERRPLAMRTAFGEQVVQAERLRRCPCGGDEGAGATVTPLAALLPERTTPELLYLETRWASLVSFGLAARMLGELLPLDRPIGAERVRRHLHAVAKHEEAELGPEEGDYFDGCQRDLFDMEQPDGPVVVGIDGGYVRDREGSWFEVIAGKGLGSFERDGAIAGSDGIMNIPVPPGRCFAFVQAFDDRPRRRMFEMLRGMGYRPNQKLIMLSDGGESVRTLGKRIGPEAEHVLDWFHVAMRVSALGQMVKGAAAEGVWRDDRLAELERAKHLLWNGHAREAEMEVGWIEGEVEAELDDADGERRACLNKLGVAVREFQVYIRRNAGSVVDYGERFRAGERISSGFVESAINQVVAKRFSKR